jgi:hypothetical protein
VDMVGSPSLFFLTPPGVRRDRIKVERMAAAFSSGSRLAAVTTEPAWVEVRNHEFTVHVPPDSLGNGWQPVRPSFMGCLGVASGLPVGRGKFITTEDLLRQPQPLSPFDSWSNKVLTAAGGLGIPVSYESRVGGFGVKSVLERRCREFEASTGKLIPRPRTWIVPPGDVDASRTQMQNATGPFVVKPANSSRGRGIEVLRDADRLKPAPTARVVQELVADPLMLDGHKIDARAYLIVHGPPLDVFQGSLVILRQAAERYRRGERASEICSISYSQRHSECLAVTTLEAVRHASPVWTKAEEAIGMAVRLLSDVVAMHPPSHPFFAIWAVDYCLAYSGGILQPYLLEVNTIPVIYRGQHQLDEATDRMIVAQAAPRLRSYCLR